MKEESLLLLSDLQKLINQVVLIDYTIIILGGERMKAVKKKLWTGWIRIQKILTEKDGISTVELILVLVVIIGLVIIFKKQLNELVTKIFEKITNESSGI